VREEMEKKNKYMEAAREAYKQEKSSEAIEEKTEKKETSESGKFEMLPSEKAKSDKKK